MTDFVALELRLIQALDRIADSIEDVHPKAELFSSTRSSQSEGVLKAQIVALQDDLDARDASLGQLKSELVDISETAGAMELERDQLSDEVQKISSQAAVLTAERDHLRTASMDIEAPADADSEVDELKSTVAILESSQSQLKAANVALVKVAKDLRKACEAQAGDADLINRTLEASVNALEANNAADTAELQALHALITPILKEANNA